MLPLLRSLEDRGEQSVRDLRDKIASDLCLTESDRAELLPSGKQAVYDNRLGWAKTYLDKAGLLRTVKRGVYVLTPRGKEILSHSPERIDAKSLEVFKEFQDFVAPPQDVEMERPRDIAELAVAGSATPEETLENAYKDLRQKTEAELLETVLHSSPRFFERLVVDLLVRMGYGGSLEEAGKALGRSHDGGVDGMIKEDHLGLDIIYVQAKRWQNTVGRPEVQGFAGTLEGERARKGVFITTASFSKEAREYVTKIDKKIVLIDGQRLSGLMFDFGIGVNAVGSYELKRVDTDYFSEE